jgi:hypothetical protein
MPRTLHDGTSLPVSVLHASFPRIQPYGQLYWPQFLRIPRPTVSQTEVMVLLWVPVHSENACYHQFKIFCLPVCYLETKTLKYKLQNYNFVRYFTCVWNWSLTLREENRLGMFENRVLRKILAPERERESNRRMEQDKQHTYKVILWRVRVEMKRQHAVCKYSWTTNHCRQYKNTNCCKKIILWRIYVAGSNNTRLGQQIKWPTFLSDF